MVRFVAHHKDGDTIIGLGLTRANMVKLMDGYPVRVSAKDLIAGTPVGDADLWDTQIVIFYGEDEDSIRAEMQDAGIDLGEMRDER